MPIYKPEEYDAVLERIKQGIKEQDIQMGPVLSEEQIHAFEQKHQITLPEGYRRFLLEVGDGCYMFDDYPSYQLLRRILGAGHPGYVGIDRHWMWSDLPTDYYRPLPGRGLESV